ncbi:GNAT family N-acetyltransferase [Paraburkholderia bengalensis]|uniref:GNAT family N-acetyltransferase n=1 Tax=Paraburkholderia bengalensis TaxID=2747562 RepID=A0ABU8J4N9_9BURK
MTSSPTPITFICRPANESDCEAVFEWENDVATRAMSANTALFSFQSHVAWFCASLQNPDRFLYVALHEGVRGGLVRFDRRDRGLAEASLILNPALRGKGFGATILRGGLESFLHDHADIQSLIATIRTTNTASMKCFVACGFVLESGDDEYNRYRRDI